MAPDSCKSFSCSSLGNHFLAGVACGFSQMWGGYSLFRSTTLPLQKVICYLYEKSIDALSHRTNYHFTPRQIQLFDIYHPRPRQSGVRTERNLKKKFRPEQKPPSDNRTPLLNNLLIGLLIGSSEAYINHPLWTLKTRIQQGKAVTFNPKVLYRGVNAHAASSIPLDAVQTTASRIFLESSFFLPYFSEAPRRLAAGFLGGCLGALISSPAEMIMTRQQDAAVNFTVACRQLWAEGRVKRLFAGFSSTLGRDSLFCCGFFAAVPILRQKIQMVGIDDNLALVVAGMSAGSITAIISQPFDTIKTAAQTSPKPLSTTTILRNIYRSDGYKGLFRGLSLRIGRVTSGIFILGALNDKLEEVFLGKRYHIE